MMVRAYRNRRRKMEISLSDTSIDMNNYEEDEEDPFAFNDETTTTTTNSTFSSSFSEFQETPQKTGNFTFSSQDSTRGVNSLTQSNNSQSPSLQLLKARKLNDGRRLGGEFTGTVTLMDTQEHGEMMECVDEVEFALAGLRPGQGVRVRRSSLLSLLNLCGSHQQRQLLKAHGMAKAIVDSILDLSLDDSPSNLAAATLFYILTSDCQDSYHLDSSPSIRFLLKLLKPRIAEIAPEKAPSISQKLLVLQKDMLMSQDMTKRVGSSSTTIMQKVVGALVSCKDLKASNSENDDMSRPELNPTWISLLTMEKACLSTISIEDTSGSMRRTCGNFKEKLRELGGLDAVFELAINFHSTLEGLIDHAKGSLTKSKDNMLLCLPLLLKCLKIMENATFLSKENQVAWQLVRVLHYHL